MTNPLDKTELTKIISEQFDIKLTEAREILEAAFAEIQAALADGRPVRLHGIGSFALKHKAPRKGRVPDGVADGVQEGAPFETPEREKVVFNASTAWCEPISEKRGLPVY